MKTALKCIGIFAVSVSLNLSILISTLTLLHGFGDVIIWVVLSDAIFCTVYFLTEKLFVRLLKLSLDLYIKFTLTIPIILSVFFAGTLQYLNSINLLSADFDGLFYLLMALCVCFVYAAALLPRLLVIKITERMSKHPVGPIE